MSVEPLIFFELVLIIFILAVSLVVIVVNLSKLINKLHSHQIGLDYSKSEENRDKSSILDEAGHKAVRIIDEANNKALDIIQKSNLFVSSTHDNFDNQLKNVTSLQLNAFEKTTAEFIQLYGRVLDDLKSKNIEIFQNVSKNIEISTLEEVKKFKNIIKDETVSSEKMVKQKIDREYLIAKKGIDIYKQNELKMIEDDIYEILEKVSSLVLGKTIKMSEHEDLIAEALDKAKKDGVFSDAK